MTNPFASEEAWEVGGAFLGVGDHLCEILEVDGAGTSSGGHPQLELKVGNAEGEIRDWIVVIPQTIGKVVQLTDAIGLERPSDDQVVPEGSGYRLAADYLARLEGQKVGVIVRSEPDYQDPTKTRERVKGYVPASQITADAPADMTGLPPSGGVVSDDDTIPF